MLNFREDGEIVYPGTTVNASVAEILGPWSPQDIEEFDRELAAIEQAERDATTESAGCWFV